MSEKKGDETNSLLTRFATGLNFLAFLPAMLWAYYIGREAFWAGVACGITLGLVIASMLARVVASMSQRWRAKFLTN